MFMQTWEGTQGTIVTCADEWWNSVIQYLFVMQLVKMTSNLYRWGLETLYNIHLLCNLCRWGVEHSTIFAMQLVQVRGGTQCNFHSWCNLCRSGWFMQWNSRHNIKLPWQPSFAGQ